MPEEKRPEQLLVSGTDNSARLKIDGIEVSLELTTARLVQDALAKSAKALDEATAKLDALTSDKDDAKAKFDALEAERDALKTKLDAKDKDDEEEDEEKKKLFIKKVDARIAFNTDASKHFDEKGWAEVKDKSEPAIREAAVRAARPKLSLDGKSETYFEAAYDLLEAPKTGGAHDLARSVLNTDSRQGEEDSELQKRCDDAMAKQDLLWKQPIPNSATKAALN